MIECDYDSKIVVFRLDSVFLPKSMFSLSKIVVFWHPVPKDEIKSELLNQPLLETATVVVEIGKVPRNLVSTAIHCSLRPRAGVGD